MANKFEKVVSDIGEALGGIANVEIYPDDYQGNIQNETRFVRYSILFGVSDDLDHQRATELSGYLVMRIFSEKGYAGKTGYSIAGDLDDALEGKKLQRGTTLGKSTLTQPMEDEGNSTLIMMQYLLPFTLFT
ncbi:hypothetical protein DSS3PM1_00065 [Bacteriophage DSS3_PM1]|nr:hypothetical protein DSS3PM1_00065 [Bacteriophage DSS3_PM1]